MDISLVGNNPIAWLNNHLGSLSIKYKAPPLTTGRPCRTMDSNPAPMKIGQGTDPKLDKVLKKGTMKGTPFHDNKGLESTEHEGSFGHGQSTQGFDPDLEPYHLRPTGRKVPAHQEFFVDERYNGKPTFEKMRADRQDIDFVEADPAQGIYGEASRDEKVSEAVKRARAAFEQDRARRTAEAEGRRRPSRWDAEARQTRRSRWGDAQDRTRETAANEARGVSPPPPPRRKSRWDVPPASGGGGGSARSSRSRSSGRTTPPTPGTVPTTPRGDGGTEEFKQSGEPRRRRDPREEEDRRREEAEARQAEREAAWKEPAVPRDRDMFPYVFQLMRRGNERYDAAVQRVEAAFERLRVDMEDVTKKTVSKMKKKFQKDNHPDKGGSTERAARFTDDVDVVVDFIYNYKKRYNNGF